MVFGIWKINPIQAQVIPNVLEYDNDLIAIATVEKDYASVLETINNNISLEQLKKDLVYEAHSRSSTCCSRCSCVASRIKTFYDNSSTILLYWRFVSCYSIVILSI